jgi:PAS domain-containing protein
MGSMAAIDESMPSGKMARRIRKTDWSGSPVGPAEIWSPAFRVSLATILASRFPMAIRWGPQLLVFYNDAYAQILGDKHPAALGRPLAEVWSEIYQELGPLNEAILKGERASYFEENQRWRVQRRGDEWEEARFTIGYSPIPDDTAPHGIGGILTTCIETTERAREEEALRTLTGTLEEEVAQRTRERDRIWQVSEDLLGVSNFDGYFVSVNPAWTALLGWSEARSGRCMSANSVTPRMQCIQGRAAPASPPVSRRCAWRTASATRTGHGAGFPGR